MQKSKATRNKKNNKQNRKQRALHVETREEDRRLVSRIPGCAAEFGRLCANPFVTTHGACLPIYPTPSSYKLTVFIKGTMVVGTAGVGFLLVSPGRLIGNNQSPGNSGVQVSTSAFTGTVTTVGPATGVASLNGNSPYGTTDIIDGDDGNQFRVVTAAADIAYAGKQLDMGGVLAGWSDPDHQQLSGAGVSDLLAKDGCEFVPVTRRRIPIVWAPASGEYQYDPVNGQGCQKSMAFVVSGAVPGVAFTYRVVAHFEVVGPLARGKSPSHPAPTQAMAVIDAVASAPGASGPGSRATSIVRALETTAEVGVAASKAAAGLGTFWVTANNIRKYITAGAEVGGAALALLA